MTERLPLDHVPYTHREIPDGGVDRTRNDAGEKLHPCCSGRESEVAFAVPGMGIVSESLYYARLAHPDCEVCAQVYEDGFIHARNGFEPSPYWTNAYRPARGRVERAGFDKYREVRGLVPWDNRYDAENDAMERAREERQARIEEILNTDYVRERE